MRLSIESLEKNKLEGVQALVLLAEQDKAFGSLPKDRSQYNAQIQAILKNQADKILTDPVELLSLASLLVIVCQLPQKKGLNRDERIRLASARILDIQKSRSLTKVAFALDQCGATDFQAVCEGLRLGGYDFRKYKTEKKNGKNPEADFLLLVSGENAKPSASTLRASEMLSSRIDFCRDLVNEPGSTLDPQTFTEQARKLAKEAGLTVRVRDEKKLQSEGFAGLWTVGKGSDRPPRLLTLTYHGGGARKGNQAKHLCLVGKGITFDTGGISIKPSQGMWEMKCDMAGAATVLASLAAIADLGLPIRASAVLCLAENRPGNAAVLPGDVFTAKNGKTIMVDNTDAEGRLVLTDGLAEAGMIGATHIIDLATLTGSVVRALGPAVAGLFCNDAEFSRAILKAGDAVGEKFCALPLEEEYREYLDDPVADMKNVGKQEAGAITAALFLQEFVPAKTLWAHWDIAGTAFTTAPWKYYKPGGTGWGVKTLVEVARGLAGS